MNLNNIFHLLSAVGFIAGAILIFLENNIGIIILIAACLFLVFIEKDKETKSEYEKKGGRTAAKQRWQPTERTKHTAFN